MTYRELEKLIKDTCKKYEDMYTYIGVRFEDKQRKIGDVCENSKHNPDRGDERDFPEYGTEEYAELPELEGTSAWLVYNGDFDYAEDVTLNTYGGLSTRSSDMDKKVCFLGDHAYIVAGNRDVTHDDPDNGEIVIEAATVIEIIY